MSVSREAIETLIAEYATTLGNAVADEFVDRAKAKSSRRSGALVDSIGHDDAVLESGAVSVRAYADSEYALYQDEGTGVYGPRGVAIVAADYGHVAFGPIEGLIGGTEFIRVNRGSAPTRFWTRTLEEWPEIVRSAA